MSQNGAQKGKIMTIETANRLYELRKKKGLSQEELAEKLGVSRQAVSKWERSESSPDTDNLIALAQLYGLSLDELIYGEKESKENKNEQANHSAEDAQDNATDKNNESAQGDDFVKYTVDGDKISFDDATILVETNEGDKVKINLGGIHVKSGDGEKISIGPHGIRIKDSDDDDDDFEEDEWESPELKAKYKASFWYKFPYPILCAIAYLVFGCFDILGGWALSWIVFITIPLYYSIVKSIYKRKFSSFAYPVLALGVYLYIGQLFIILQLY